MKCFLYKAGGNMTPLCAKPHAPSQGPVINLGKTFHSLSWERSFSQRSKSCLWSFPSASLFHRRGNNAESFTRARKPFRCDLSVWKTLGQSALNSVPAPGALCAHTALPSLLAAPVPSCSAFTCTCLPINTSLRHTPAAVSLKPTALQH